MRILFRLLKSTWLPFLSAIILLYVTHPLFVPFVRGNADGVAHRFRLYSFSKAVSEGDLRPRWIGDSALGYGAPLFLFNYSLPYYGMLAIQKLGVPFLASVQLFHAFTLIGSFICMYLAARSLWGRWAGLVAASAYVFAPYHLLSVYLYDAWGEMTAFIFPPLILYLLIKGKKQSQGKRFIDFHFIFLVSSWCLLIFSHNISALLYSPILLFLGFALYRKQLKLFITYVVYPYFLAVLITSFFWMPAIMLSKYIRYPALINSEIAVRAAYYKPLGMLVRTAFDSIQAGQTRYTDFTMGIPILIAGISVVILGLIRIKKVIKNHTLIHIDGVFVGILLFFFAFALYCMDHASDWIWRTKLFNYVVYPYRFLVIVTFTGSLLAGYVARKRFLMVLLFLTISFICAQPYLNPYASILPFSYEYFTQPQTVLHAPGTNKGTSMAEFLPIWTDMDYLKSIDMKYLAEKILPEPVEIPDGGKLISVEKNMEDIKTIIELNKSTDIPFNTLYFPNWKGYVDAREVTLTKDSYGRILVPVPAGSHTIRLSFGISQIEVIGIILSGIGVVVLGVSAFHQYISTDSLNRRKDHRTGRVSL